jgi:hypothetical protein
MADAYPYLIASLPMLHPGMKPPFSFDRFLGLCREWIPERDYQVLSTLPQPSQYSQGARHHRLIEGWIGFDTALRNELARERAGRRPLAPGVHAATAHASPLDAERALDEMRWKALEDLATGHYLDLDVLLAYACRLQILLRWERIRAADGRSLLEQALRQ